MAPVGEAIVWEATIKANPKPKVTWQCDGRDVTIDDRFTTEEEYKKKKYRLRIREVDICDGGGYKIIASNEMGESSEEAQLKPYSELTSLLNLNRFNERHSTIFFSAHQLNFHSNFKIFV